MKKLKEITYYSDFNRATGSATARKMSAREDNKRKMRNLVKGLTYYANDLIDCGSYDDNKFDEYSALQKAFEKYTDNYRMMITPKEEQFPN